MFCLFVFRLFWLGCVWLDLSLFFWCVQNAQSSCRNNVTARSLLNLHVKSPHTRHGYEILFIYEYLIMYLCTFLSLYWFLNFERKWFFLYQSIVIFLLNPSIFTICLVIVVVMTMVIPLSLHFTFLKPTVHSFASFIFNLFIFLFICNNLHIILILTSDCYNIFLTFHWFLLRSVS